ncbi:MAG TPA: hypothetical protein PK156_17800 [Polyangium sp.]|nr:hypothetical protein [Polyangium sp.]
MSITQRDYIMRLIAQFAEVLARILGLRKAGKLDEAQKLVNETADGIFGSLRSMIEQVDVRTAAGLLGSRDKLIVYAALTAQEAEIALSKGQTRKATGRRRRALELYLEASCLGELDATARTDVESLKDNVDVEQLDSRYRELLGRLAGSKN